MWYTPTHLHFQTKEQSMQRRDFIKAGAAAAAAAPAIVRAAAA
ncbi:MAG: twin-arginine translocation signal domain-containing protein, partial [Kiritimatiellae bacterium]|nr:twin-arginine translocation signal domain-containing protein [Kiritimatiellia bacterium]